MEATVDPRWEFTRVWRNLTAGTSVARLAVAFAEPVRAAAELTAVYADAAIRGDFTEAASPIGVSIKAVANCLPLRVRLQRLARGRLPTSGSGKRPNPVGKQS